MPKIFWPGNQNLIHFPINAGIPAVHAGSHIDGGSDAIDGDKLEISYTPASGYARSTAPTEVDQLDQLTAHLHGIAVAIAAISNAYDVIYIRDQKAVNTAGGTFTSGAWQTRDINTEVIDTGNHCTIGTNDFTLTAGNYIVIARAPAIQVQNHKAKLRQTSATAADIIIGSSAYSLSSATGYSESWVIGRFVASGTPTYEIQHFCALTKATNGFGDPSNFVVVEAYTEVLMLKEK